MTDNKHTVRIAVLLALMVVALVVVSIDHFRTMGKGDQQATVLRAYAK